ncbi:MAG: hypothetical protein LUF68_02280, partial [Clostridiales bacterium]|nr:hypothetical protein [Clostridiales bacterium]
TQELEIAKLEKEITGCNVRFQRSSQDLKPKIREEAIEKHRKLEAIMDQNDNLSKQQILLSCYIIGTENGPYSLEQGLALLTEAIRLTSPKFDLKQFSEGIYTEMEIKLINCMATCYFNAGRHDDAIDILKALLAYLQSHLQKLPSDRAHIPMVAFNYARELETVKKYEEAIEIAEYAKKVCIDFGHYQNLSSILMVMAECYYHLGRDAESAELYRQAFYLYKVLEDDVNRSILQEEAKAYLGLNLE